MDRKLRIAVLNQREGGGATAVALDLAAQAREAGHDVAYLPGAEALDDQGLARAVVAFAPDLVHAHCFYNAWSPEILRSLSRFYPVVFTVHDVYPANQYGTECWECSHNRFCVWCPALPVPKRLYSVYRVRSRLRRDRAWKGLRANVVFPSRWIRARLAQTTLGRLPGQVVPYGVDTQRFAPDPGAKAALRCDTRPVILTVGNMYSADDDRKGFAVLFRAFAEGVRSVVPEARLVVLGKVLGFDPPDGCELRGEASSADVALWHAAADVFVLPSLGDNLPVAVLEAMASGAPVVASGVGGIPEEVAHETTGLIVPPRDPVALAGAIVRLLREPDSRRRMGAAGRSRAEGEFSRARAWDTHARVYASVAGAPP